MPSEDHISDDYVAKLITKDAKESTIRYSAFGLQELLPKRLFIFYSAVGTFC